MLTFFSLLGFVVRSIVDRAFAAPIIYCGNLPGCGDALIPAPPQEYFSSVLILLGTNIPAYAYALGVLFIMIGGAYMVLSAGRDDWVTKGKTTITWAIIGIAATSFASDIVSMIQVQVNGRVAGTDLIISLNNTIVSTIFNLLNISLLGVSIYCGMWMVLSRGKQDEFNKARDAMLWSAVGAIVINLAWSIANAFATL